MSTINDLRPSPIAGTWYSGNAKTLAAQVDRYVAEAELPSLPGEVLGVIAPHAGHRYSGRTAGHAFRAVQGLERDLVVVVSPLHAYHPAPFLTTAHAAYATPLGVIPVDQEAVLMLDRELDQAGGVGLLAVANDQEHSLEIELPFIQQTLKGKYKLLPVMVRNQSIQSASNLGTSLARVLKDRSFLLVASTDLSHFYTERAANVLDAEMLHQIESFSPEGVLEAEHSGKGFACGAGAVAAVLWAARELGGNTVKILHHSTSGDETGDRSSVVGYGAAVILKTL